MIDSLLLPPLSWLSSVASFCLIALRSVVFLPPWINQWSRPCVRCFSKIWLREPLRPSHQVDCGIVWAIIGSSRMLMGPSKPHDNEPFPRFPNFPLLIDALIRSVLLPILGASEGRWLGPGQRCSRRIHSAG